MRYKLKQIHCRPWTLSYLSVKLIESHYENNYGGALRRLNAITEQLESLDFANTPAHVLNGLKREELVALNSTLLHELYFASMGGEGKVTPAMSEALVRDFGSVQNWRTDLKATGMAGRGWAWTAYDWDEGHLFNYIGDAQNTFPIWNATPLVALDVYEHAYFIDYQTDRASYVDAFFENLDWQVVNGWVASYSIPF